MTTLAGSPALPWKRGWVIDDDVEWLDKPATAAKPAAQRHQGELMIRGFGHYGGTLFTANDSFDAVFDSSFGMSYGGGGQVVFGNGLFVQGSVERFQDTGVRIIVSDAEVFRTDIENKVTVTPILGYRSAIAIRIRVGFWGRRRRCGMAPAEGRVPGAGRGL